MSFSVGQLGIEVQVASHRTREGGACASTLEERLPSAIGPYLGPRFDRGNEVVRIRELRVRAIVSSNDLGAEKLIDHWLSAFAQQLFRMLALPSDPIAWGVYREASAALFRARFLKELLSGGDAAAWYFHEFADVLLLARSEGAMAILEIGALADTLLALHEIDGLDAVLSVLSTIQTETLIRIASEPAGVSLQPSQLIAALELAQRRPCAIRRQSDAHSNALRLWIESLREAMLILPRVILKSLTFAQHIRKFEFNPAQFDAPDLARVFDDLSQPGHEPERDRLLELASAVYPHLTSTPMPDEKWLTSEHAGLLLLLPLVERRQWWRLRAESAFADPAFSCLLAGVAMQLCGHGVDPDPKVLADPAIYVFAGEGSSLSASVVRSFAARNDWARGANVLGIPASEFDGLTFAMAELLAEEFSTRIRGFRKLSLQGVRQLFLQRAGKLRLSTGQLEVLLAPSPYNIALHLAGMDSEFATSGWFGARRIVIRLEDL